MPEDLNALESVWRDAELRPLAAGRLFASVAEWMWYTVATVYAFTLAGVGAVGAIGVAAVFPAHCCRRRWAMSSTGSRANASWQRCSRCASSR